MKTNKKYIVISCVLILICIFGFFIYNYNCKKNHDNIITDELNIDNKQRQEVTPKLYINNKTAFNICLFDESGKLKQTKIYFNSKGSEAYKELINYLFFKELNNNKNICIPNDLKILDIKIWNETLIINLNEKANYIKIKDSLSEKKVLTTIINSLLLNKNEFTDVQFLINDKRVNKLFGFTNTRNPFMEIS